MINKRSGARKRFGQHFLRDQAVIQRIIQAVSPQPGDHIIEIGPGRGAITGPLLASGCQLDAIELDRDLVPILQRRFSDHERCRIIQNDALTLELALLQQNTEPLRIVGNLPYNISTPLIFHLLNHSALIKDMHIMLQREVASRLSAKPVNKSYGRLSVMTQYYCQVESLFDVPPNAFKPIPKVTSTVVRLVPHISLPYRASNIKTLQTVLRVAFSQRRKTLRNALKDLLPEERIEKLAIDRQARPDTLSLKQFVSISNTIDFFPNPKGPVA